MELIVFVLELIIGEVVLVLAYVVVWAILIPCVFVIATPPILVLAWIRFGGFRENAKRYYRAIFQHVRGMPEWMRIHLQWRRRS